MKKALVAAMLFSSICFGQGCSDSTSSPQADSTLRPSSVQTGSPQAVKAAENEKVSADTVDEILVRLNDRAGEIQTYQCVLEHLSRQPLFDSQTLRTGRMYYLRGKKQSLLRVDFDTLKQDDEPEEKYKEQFFFDGIWLTRVDYQLKEVKKHQLIDPNKLKENESIDAFDLLSEHLPIVGFTGTDKLRKEFKISLSDANAAEANDLIRLHMEVKPDSVYKDDWVWIDFWIDKKLYLPAKMITLTTEEDVYEISFLKASLNEAIDVKVFKVQIPDGFTQPEVIPLKRQAQNK
jgi:hypothetical protein